MRSTTAAPTCWAAGSRRIAGAAWLPRSARRPWSRAAARLRAFRRALARRDGMGVALVIPSFETRRMPSSMHPELLAARFRLSNQTYPRPPNRTYHCAPRSSRASSTRRRMTERGAVARQWHRGGAPGGAAAPQQSVGPARHPASSGSRILAMTRGIAAVGTCAELPAPPALQPLAEGHGTQDRAPPSPEDEVAGAVGRRLTTAHPRRSESPSGPRPERGWDDGTPAAPENVNDARARGGVG